MLQLLHQILINEITHQFNSHCKTSYCECDSILLATTYHTVIFCKITVSHLDGINFSTIVVNYKLSSFVTVTNSIIWTIWLNVG